MSLLVSKHPCHKYFMKFLVMAQRTRLPKYEYTLLITYTSSFITLNSRIVENGRVRARSDKIYTKEEWSWRFHFARSYETPTTVSNLAKAIRHWPRDSLFQNVCFSKLIETEQSARKITLITYKFTRVFMHSLITIAANGRKKRNIDYITLAWLLEARYMEAKDFSFLSILLPFRIKNEQPKFLK